MRRHLLGVLLIGAGIGLAPPNARADINATLNQFTGANATIGVNVTESATTPGDLLFTLNLTSPTGPGAGDITGFWANTGGTPVNVVIPNTTVAFSTYGEGAVNNLGNGVNLQGGGSPAPLDFGVRFNKPGDGSQTSVSFELHSSAGALSPDLFDGKAFAARVQAMSSGEGSSKLTGVGGTGVPNGNPGGSVPDSSSAATLLGFSLMGIEALRRRFMK